MPNNYSLKMMPQAERDLDGIYAYIAHELTNVQAAERLMEKIEESLIALEAMPNGCPFSEIPELRNDGYRKCVIENYIALYKVDEKRKLVVVAKIFYGMRDYNNLGSF